MSCMSNVEGEQAIDRIQIYLCAYMCVYIYFKHKHLYHTKNIHLIYIILYVVLFEKIYVILFCGAAIFFFLKL